MGISLCMIVKNEESNLERCLNSIKEIADEIIITDTGSNDRTLEIAKKFNAKLFHFKWKDDFSKARNFSISKAAKPWIFLIDADETISKRDLGKIRELTKDKMAAGYKFIQRTYSNNPSITKWNKKRICTITDS